MGPIARRDILRTMPSLHSRLGTWELENVHAWSGRALEIRAPAVRLVGPETRVATIGSCFAAELASMMDVVGINGAMHPGGLFYSTTTIRQELERIAGGWPERAAEPAWAIKGGLVDPFRDYDTIYRTRPRSTPRARPPTPRRARCSTGQCRRRHPRPDRDLAQPGDAEHVPPDPPPRRVRVARAVVPPADGDRDARGPRAHPDRHPRPARGGDGRDRVAGPAPHDLHAARRRVANAESKGRIRAAVSEFVDRHPDVHYFHSYEMVVTAERQSDYFRDDGRHVHRHAVRYIVAEFLRLYADPSLQLHDVDSSWLTPIDKTAPIPTKEPKDPSPKAAAATKPAKTPGPVWRRVARKTKRAVGSALGRA